MFKTFLRTLSALSIVTITASAGFAQSTGPTDCDAPWNQNHEDCTASTKIWLNDFTPSINAPSINSSGVTNGVDSGFVEFGAKGFKNDDDDLIFTNDPKRGKLNLKRANETIGGVLFYRGQNTDNDSYLYHAGIKSGTNLGRPLTEGLVSASWSNGSDTWSDTWTKGSFKAVGGVSNYNANKKNFELKVTFGGETAQGKVGSISSLVNLQGQQHYRIDGKFDSKGVIEGTVIYGLFNASSDLNPYTGLGRIDGTLSGLIGDQGAVGVFYSKTDSGIYGLRGFSGGFVVKSNFDVGEAELFRTCVLSPFDRSCSDTKFDSHKIARIEHCITGDNSATDKTCVGAIGATSLEVSCISNPFQTACKDANADYAAQYVAARDNRVVFCVDSANSENAVCMGDTIVAGVCGVNPFGEVCEGKFDEAANNRLIECQQDGVAGGTQCAHADTIIDKCKLAPFEDECAWGAFDDERKELIATCHNGGECADAVLERPNAATWVNSFRTSGDREGLGILPNADTYDRNQPFLKNIESAQNPDSGIEIDIINEPATTLNLRTAEFNGTPLGGDAKDGVTSFIGHATGQSPNWYAGQYAGIFSTTDLGAPLTKPSDSEPKTASWVGSFRHDYPHYSRDFVLEVNFDTQSIEAFVHAYLIKGDYDDNGVISGTVAEDSFINRYKTVTSEYAQIHPLTGLIGKEGAVGVFPWGAFVARPADLVVDETTGKTAETFLNGLCDGNPFHKFCYLSDKREERIRHCSTDDNAINTDTSIVNWDCMTDVESDSCIRHPFDEKCKPTATSHYETARENRSAFCKKDANVAHLFCIGAEQNALCLYDPFHTICSNAIYNNARKIVCKADSSHTGCTDAHKTLNNNVTAISWLAGLYKDDGVVPQTKPDTIRPRDQFLQGTTDGLDNGDVEIGTTYSGDVPQFGSLNLDTATFDGLELGLGKDRQDREDAAADGVAYFRDRYLTAYAGIFSGTDLGEPLVKPTEGADMTAKWYGQFQVWNFKTDFTLNIDFSADGSVGTLEAFVYSGGNGDYFFGSKTYYLLKGKFDENGVISGTVDYGDFPNHNQTLSRIELVSPLTGLIGEEGAVGAFTGLNSGMFVASSKSAADAFDPNVKASDWVRSFGNTPVSTHAPYNAPQQALFLQGTETGLNTWNTVPQTLTLADGDLGGESADGVAYAFFNRRYHVAGLLSGTHLGATLPTVPAGANGAITATWYGKLGLIADGSEVAPRDIDLMVDFTNKRISHSSDVDGEHLVNFSATWKSGVNYDGVFTGDITYDATPTLQTNGKYVATDSSKSEGIVTGLIGQQGAVGAFKSYHGVDDTGANTPFAGGFVATPGVDHLAWMNSFSNPSDVSVGVGSVPSQKQTQFVQGTGTSLNVGLLDNSVTRTLKLADGDLGGDAADGAVYASGTWQVLNAARDGTNRTPRHYAGLLSGINLGLPLSTVPAGANGAITAIWDGKLGLIANRVEIPKRDIDLTVDFTNKRISHSSAVNGAHFVNLNANWENGVGYDGVLKGTITYNPGAALDNLAVNSADSAGTVTGLIGQQGAVGAFISDGTGDTPYAGGFVAVPVANYANWVDSFGNPTSLPVSVPWYHESQPQTEFLQGREADLKPGLINNLVPRSLDFANSGLGGEATDGVAYLSGTWDVDSSDVPRHFAGILSGTNLGALLNAPVTATWNGKLGMIVDGNGDIPNRDITLNIDFARKGIEIAYTREPSTHFVGFNGLSFDEAGVISGTMTYNPGATSVSATNSAGKVTGLIGTKGAVGAFISDSGTSSSFAGGFVAVPPAEPASP